MKRRALALCAFAFVFAIPGARAGAASLSPAARATLVRYLNALESRRYDIAFALLGPDERRYFGSAANFASGFEADRLRISGFSIEDVATSPSGSLASVREHLTYADSAHGRTIAATARVAYGVVNAGGVVVVKDPNHPWRALAPNDLSASAHGVRVVVRKLAFYTGRLEMVATFLNQSPSAVTFLPYGRTSLRDERAKAYAPIASRLPRLTDQTLYAGLRLPSGGEYTGAIDFLTPARFSPARLSLVVAPALADGSNAPFELDFPPYSVSDAPG